jgi:hypothetical protein
MLISAVAAIVMFAAPETTKGGDAAAEKPAKHCYTAKPSGSRLSRKVCVTQARDTEKKSEKDIQADPKPEAAKPE